MKKNQGPQKPDARKAFDEARGQQKEAKQAFEEARGVNSKLGNMLAKKKSVEADDKAFKAGQEYRKSRGKK